MKKHYSPFDAGAAGLYGQMQDQNPPLDAAEHVKWIVAKKLDSISDNIY